MTTTRRALLIAVLVGSSGHPALAQPPGVRPFGTGVSIMVPGGSPITVQVFGDDLMINAAGQPPSVVRATDAGAVIRSGLGQPVTVQRTGSMVVINAPGSAPVTCNIADGRLSCR